MTNSDQKGKQRRTNSLPKGPKGRTMWKRLAEENNLRSVHINMALRLAVSPSVLLKRAESWRSQGVEKSVGGWIEREYEKEFGQQPPPSFRYARGIAQR